MLCTGQSSRIQGNSNNTIFAVLLEEVSTFHMVRAALQAQSSLSVGSQPQHCGLGSHRLVPSPASAHSLSLAAPSDPVPAGGQDPRDRVLRVREGAWQQALGLICHCWEMKQLEGPGTLHQSDNLHGMGSAE